MPVLKLITKTGQVSQIECKELLEVDGRPYEHTESLRDLVMYDHSRLDLICQKFHITLPGDES